MKIPKKCVSVLLMYLLWLVSLQVNSNQWWCWYIILKIFSGLENWIYWRLYSQSGQIAEVKSNSLYIYFIVETALFSKGFLIVLQCVVWMDN